MGLQAARRRAVAAKAEGLLNAAALAGAAVSQSEAAATWRALEEIIAEVQLEWEAARAVELFAGADDEDAAEDRVLLGLRSEGAGVVCQDVCLHGPSRAAL